jgi:hypothetical protein
MGVSVVMLVLEGNIVQHEIIRTVCSNLTMFILLCEIVRYVGKIFLLVKCLGEIR